MVALEVLNVINLMVTLKVLKFNFVNGTFKRKYNIICNGDSISIKCDSINCAFRSIKMRFF